MKLSDLIILSLRSFSTRFLRTGLTVLGISLGIGAVLFLVSLGYGLQNIVLENITSDEALLSLDVIPPSAGLVVLDKKAVADIGRLEHVEEVSPVLKMPAQIGYKNLKVTVSANATEPSYFRLAAVEPEWGEILDESDEIMVSSAVAKVFDTEPFEMINKEISLTIFLPLLGEEDVDLQGAVPVDKIGSQIFTPSKLYRITGVIADDFSTYIYFSLSEVSELDNFSFDQAKVKVDVNENLELVRDKILDMGFGVSAVSETVDQANKIFKAIQVVLGLFGVVALMVAAIGMFNTMTISLLERTQEIGIMRSLGASAKDVAMLFLAESAVIGFIGGIAGLFLGLVGGALMDLGISTLAKALGGGSINLFQAPLWFIIMIVIFSTFVGIITGLWPAKRAAKLDPLSALRYK